VGLTILPYKNKIVEKPPRNSAGFCGGGQGLSWAVEPRKEEEEQEQQQQIEAHNTVGENIKIVYITSECSGIQMTRDNPHSTVYLTLCSCYISFL
jgi:hypothetical protein